MSDIWYLINDPCSVDPELLRIYRWCHQWIEAFGYPTVFDPSEAEAATSIPRARVVEIFEQMVVEGFAVKHAERPDGAWWMNLIMHREVRRQERDERLRLEPRLDKEGKAKPLPPERKRNVPLGLRWDILERDRHQCRKCGRKASDGISLVIDHITPYSKGGLTTAENLQVLCNECNTGKRNKLEIVA